MFDKSSALSLIGIFVASTLTVAACGSADSHTSVAVSGSSTVEPISVRVAELFEDVNPAIEVDVDGPGTGDGFALFCEGRIDIAGASRPIGDTERSNCEANGVDFTALEVARDGITVLVSPANDLDCIDFADLYALMGPESGNVEDWDDAASLATDLGSDTDLPHLGLDINAPGAESGTYGSFTEIVLEGIHETRVREGETEPVDGDPIRNYPGQSDDNVILQGIAGGPDGAFGYVGFAFAQEAGDGIKKLSVSETPEAGCVAPSAEAIADGSYPISRPLLIYVNDTAAREKPAVVEYVDFYLGEGATAAEEVGYVALNDEARARSASTWASAGT